MWLHVLLYPPASQVATWNHYTGSEEKAVIVDPEKGHIPILMYHSISSQASSGFRPCIVTPETFDKHLSYLEQQHYTSLTVTQLVQALVTGSDLPARPIVITFDDGYADFYTAALPALQRHGFSATLYVATAFIGGTSRWLQHMDEGDRPMLTWEQLAEISASGIECGAHTHTHPALDMLPPSEARNEILRSRRLLEEHLGQHVASFAYPFGFHNPRLQQIVRESGFASACVIKRKMISDRDNLYTLPRLAIWPDTNEHMLAAALSSGRGPLIASPVKQARMGLRLRLRGVYGRVRYGWNLA